MKYSKNFERDWSFYTKNINKFTFCGTNDILLPEYDQNGLTAKEFFYKFDNGGLKAVQNKKCKEPNLVYDVIKFKKGLNFHIKMWAEGFWDYLEHIDFYFIELEEVPEWPKRALAAQALKLFFKKIKENE